MTRGHRISVRDPHPDGAPFDYADAFEIARERGDDRTPEQALRAALGHTAGAAAVLAIHRRVLRFELGPWSSPEHIIGWSLRPSDRERVHLAASGPLMTGALVVTADADVARVTTYVTFNERRRAAAVWAVVGTLHRAIAPRLLTAVAATPRSTSRVLTRG